MNGHPPEDKILRVPFPKKESKELFGIARRFDRAFGNSVESVPLDLIIAWMAVFCGSKNETDLQRHSIMAYTCLRVAHTICFIFKLQPFRTLSFVASKVCVLFLAFKGYKNVAS